MSNRTCEADGCDRPVKARGLCGRCYQRKAKYGDPLIKRTPVDYASRFWAKVNKDGPVPVHQPELGKCWVWTGAPNASGYGSIMVNRVILLAHRFSWQLNCGPIPAGMFVLHRCDNPPCVRPDHLFLGTNADNMADMVQKGRSRGVPGAANSHAKLSEAQVIEIRARYMKGDRRNGGVALAAEYGISVSAICHIVYRRSWRSVA